MMHNMKMRQTWNINNRNGKEKTEHDWKTEPREGNKVNTLHTC